MCVCVCACALSLFLECREPACVYFCMCGHINRYTYIYIYRQRELWLYILSGPLKWLNAILLLLQPLNRYRTPSAIGSALSRRMLLASTQPVR